MVSLRNKDNAELLIKETLFLSQESSLSERLYCWVNNITEIQTCPICGNKECKSALIAKSNKESFRDWNSIQEKMKALV